jgi:hypothetical protein
MVLLFYWQIACNDINFEEDCYCKNCKFWKEYNLENSDPMEYIVRMEN